MINSYLPDISQDNQDNFKFLAEKNLLMSKMASEYVRGILDSSFEGKAYKNQMLAIAF